MEPSIMSGYSIVEEAGMRGALFSRCFFPRYVKKWARLSSNIDGDVGSGFPPFGAAKHLQPLQIIFRTESIVRTTEWHVAEILSRAEKRICGSRNT